MVITKESSSRRNHIYWKKIQRNYIREQEVLKELEKDKEQIWEDNGIVYIKGRIYVPNN